jgi:hypothetical protein
METLSEMKKKYKISISPGNIKMGNIPSVSLPPHLSCITALKCYYDRCYAQRMVIFRPNIGKAWHRNYLLYATSPYAYKELLKDSIRTMQSNGAPKYFRWHVGGDIVNVDYWNMMCSVANEMDDTRFLVLTKKYYISERFKYKPENLSVLISLWPNEARPIQNYIDSIWKGIRDIRNQKIAWLEDDPRIRSEAFNPFRCYGSCVHCKQCWTDQRDIILMRH